MFLFTDTSPAPNAGPSAGPPPSSRIPNGPVVDAIRQGAARSGTSFDYLLATAQRESALDPAARASTSSASGLFQFVEQTWLGLVKSEGPAAGLSAYSNAISTRADGTLAVSDPSTRQAILKLRDDPGLSATMAGALTEKNRTALKAETGRQPSPGDLYAAHVLGARGAAELIGAATAEPDRSAALDFPDAAAANRALFYDRAGRARGAAEVYSTLTATHSALPVSVNAASTSGAVDGETGPLPAQPGPLLQGLFQTALRTGPVSGAVAKVWRTNNSVAAPAAAPARFFPHGSGDQGATSTQLAADESTGSSDEPAISSPTPVAAGTAAVPAGRGSPPLPPPRPHFAGDEVAPAADGHFLAFSRADRRR